MGWGKKRTLAVQTEPVKKARSRKKTIALASSIGLGIGTVLLGVATVWLLSMQSFLQDITP
jgi:multisubunit Na+/H+ antiporter MnhB subunit